MEAELTALAAAAATALVGTMVTEGWSQAKAGLTRLFSRRRRTDGEGEEEDQLERSRRELEEAQERGDDDAATRVEDELRQSLGQLLASDPEAVRELRSWLAEFAPSPVQAVVAGGVQGTMVQAARIDTIAFHVPAAPERGATARPDQVPPQTVRFINRSADLSKLSAWFVDDDGARSRVGVGVLDGLPGVGKSATAREYAFRFRDLYPDGQIYVDFAALRGTGDSAGDVSEAVGMGLRSLGVSDANIPDTLAERTNLFRSRSAGRRLLVVLDDVSQPAHVRALVPKEPGSTVLATSSTRLGELAAFDGARLLSLRPLEAESALRILADRCGQEAVDAEPDAAERLVELCGRLPVALHVAASRLLMTPGLSLAELADMLDEESGRLAGLSLGGSNSMSALLNDAYRQLPAEAARAFRLLGRLPGRTFDAGVVAAATETTTSTARSLLTRLHDASLVERLADGRYHMHDLVRLYATERADAEERTEGGEPQGDARRALVERVATHYLTLTAFADRAVREDRLRIAELDDLLARSQNPFTRRNAPKPLDWLEAERHAILAVLREAERHQLHAVVWPLAEAFTVLFLNHRHLGEWRESLELGAAAARAAVVPAAEARLRSLLSRPLMDLGEFDVARAELDAAQACAEIADHTVLRASVLEFTGRYWDRFDPPRAVETYGRSRELNAQAGEERGAAIALYFQGRTQSSLGEHEAALDALREARRRLRACGDQRMAARVTLALGIAHERMGDLDEAAVSLRAAADALKEQEAHHYEAEALEALAAVRERTGAPADAVRADLRRALEVYDDEGNPRAEELRALLGE